MNRPIEIQKRSGRQNGRQKGIRTVINRDGQSATGTDSWIGEFEDVDKVVKLPASSFPHTKNMEKNNLS